ncbi:WD40-repeat-containing domain protein [Elsinoe ampelina]|uniref:WD40-repeat-containing domain protein n=1 Tax=Elsinoe ampelina TaxID=302913 RepID=A0A6A6GPT8_9PEZI|nr:WD40-repeat-containing domain protein [Elsinoe ampelina]
MKLTSSDSVPVYTIAGSSTARPLPEWLARKRKRSLKKDPEYANRVELLQDFEFEEASSCVRVSEDGDWLMSTGTYKPQIHVHYLPHLSLSFARHTNSLNQKFVLLSSDYTKSLHLQSDRFLEFQGQGNLHYAVRIPRYGRDLVYVNKSAEALVPAVGVNENGNGEVFRLNLELGRFMKGYEVDVGGDDTETVGAGSLQGGINTGAVNAAAVAENSHNMLAFGTSLGTVEFWDPRSKSRVATLAKPQHYSLDNALRPEISALEFHSSGLRLAAGTSTGLVSIYDLRSPVPLLQKEQGYDEPIQNLRFLDSAHVSDKVMSADKRNIKIWDAETGDAWTSVEPAVDLNHVEWVPNTGMFLTANEGRQQHSFLVPQLGPAPRWCAFLDNLVEEMAEDADDPSAYKNNGFGTSGTVYDNYKFLSMQQLRELNMDHLVGQTSLLRPYMHGYFVAQKLYEQAKLISNPLLFEQEREKSIQEKIAKERESRIRGSKAVKVKVNRKFAEKLLARDEANERRKARRVLRQGGDEPKTEANGDEDTRMADDADEEVTEKTLVDPRFSGLFQNEDFEIDESSREFAMLNPSSVPNGTDRQVKKRGLTAAEQEELEERRGLDSSDSESDQQDEDEAAISRQRKRRGQDEEGDDRNRISASSYGKAGKRRGPPQAGPKMLVSSSNSKPQPRRRDQSFGALASDLSHKSNPRQNRTGGGVVGEKQVTFAPSRPQKKQRPRAEDLNEADSGRHQSRGARRSASGNTFRRM